MSAPDARQRSIAFSTSTEPRFWWHRLPGNEYVPPIYASLTEDEWRVLEDWYADTSRENLIGECAVPMMSLLQSFVMGSNVRRIVQLGTHSGYSALLLGFFLRRSRAQQGLISFEIGEALCAYTRAWLERAGLTEYVHIEHRSSLDDAAAIVTRDYLGGSPELVFVDSSHEYGNTFAELESWYPELAPGGLMVLHDASEFAASFDVTQQGGVRRALREWRDLHPGVETFSLNHDVRELASPGMVYKDFCGAALIQKPLQPQ
ncbi:MAG: class I SAM-dependent methyltransferase [Chthoniobacterales bacterium]|nr:class I SAM-dependent methyltransferase [Chthoniobacterales bacterium]